MDPIFSRRQTVEVQPEGSPRRYTIAPLTFSERAQWRAEMTRRAGIMPHQGQIKDALRRAVRELSPGNADELLDVIETGAAMAEEAQADLRAGRPISREAEEALSRMTQIEIAASRHPGYAQVLAAQQEWIGMMPFVTAMFALRGWEGEGLPAFQRVRGMVPAELLEAVPEDELSIVGWRAQELMTVNKVAEGNSALPSPSPEIPAPATAESCPTTEAAGS